MEREVEMEEIHKKGKVEFHHNVVGELSKVNYHESKAHSEKAEQPHKITHL